MKTEENIQNEKAREYGEDGGYDKIFEGVSNVQNAVSVVLKTFIHAKKWGILFTLVLYLVKHSPTYVLPIGIAAIIDIATWPQEHTMSEMWLWALFLGVLIVQNYWSHAWYMKYSGRILRNYGSSIRNFLVKKLQYMTINGIKHFESGVLQSKFIRDIETIESFLGIVLRSLLPTVATILITSIITVAKSPLVALFFLLVIPVNVLVVKLFRKKLTYIHRDYRMNIERTSAQMTNMIEMLNVTKSHGLEEVEIRKLKKNIDNLKTAGFALDATDAHFGASSWISSSLLSIVCLIFTGALAYQGKISVGDVVLYQTYFNNISGNVQSLLNMVSECAKGAEAIKSVSEIVICNDMEDNKGKIPLRYVHGTLQFKNVSYQYPDGDAYSIKNFNLQVEPGECVAFVGASGSGKTTIMNMIIGFLLPTEGELLIDGKPIEALDMASYRHFLSVVPQNCVLFPGTIRENILYGCEDVSEERLKEVVKLANIEPFLDQLPNGMDSNLAEHGGNLSGGQKQRISIARAFIRNPSIIIFDEATSALDNISEYRIQQAMESLAKGRTTFLVAHRLSTIRNADKIVVMENGACVEYGAYEELIARKGKFYELKTLSELDGEKG